jgi:hypothetical protein
VVPTKKDLIIKVKFSFSQAENDTFSETIKVLSFHKTSNNFVGKNWHRDIHQNGSQKNQFSRMKLSKLWVNFTNTFYTKTKLLLRR